MEARAASKFEEDLRITKAESLAQLKLQGKGKAPIEVHGKGKDPTDPMEISDDDDDDGVDWAQLYREAYM